MKLKTLAAIAVAGIMAMSVPMVAMAADVTETIEDSANVDGNVIVSTGEAINVYGKTVNVTGIAKTTADATAIRATIAHVTTHGAENTSSNETIHAYSGGDITVYGDVKNNGTGTAIQTEDGGTVKVDGDVKNNGTSTAIQIKDGGTVKVDGDVKAANGAGIQIAAKGMVKVDGDVTASDGIVLSGTVANDGDIVVAINGELTSGLAIRGTGLGSVEDQSDCKVYIYGLTTSGDVTVGFDANNINYIIHGNDGKADYSNMTITDSDGSALETIDINNGTYKVSKAGNISVTVDDGYEFSTGAAIVSVNGNKYLITVPSGGHVTLKAIKKAIQQARSSGSTGTFTEYPSELGSKDNPITGGEWKEEDGKWYYIYQGSKLIHTVARIKYTDKDGKEILGCYYFDKSGVMVTDKTVTVNEGNTFYFGNDGRLNGETDREETKLSVPDSVTKIGEEAFQNTQKSKLSVITPQTDSSEYATLPVYANIDESLYSEKTAKQDDLVYRTESADKIIEIGPAFDPKLIGKKTAKSDNEMSVGSLEVSASAFLID